MQMKSFLIFITCIVSANVLCEAVIYSDDHSKNYDPIISSNKHTPINKESWLWQEYVSTNRVVNREELRIVDIQESRELNLQRNITNWQYVVHKYEFYLVGTENSTLFLYHFDQQKNLLTPRANLSVSEKIKSFKVISFSSNDEQSTDIQESIVVILSIDDANQIQYLKWFYLRNNKFYSFWIWELLKTIKSLEHFDIDDKHKLLVLYEKDVYFNHNYSLIEVYDIKISSQFSKQLSCQFLVTEISDIRICPAREGTKTFALMDKDYVTLHEYTDILSKCALESVKNITVSNVSNVICFESSNINHLAVSGYVTNFYKFYSDEFVYEEQMETLLDGVGDINFITTLPVDTYRNDVVLLIQLRNSTVVALCWQNEKFESVRLPNKKIENFDLSKAIVIPNYGFLIDNRFIELKIKLVELPNPEFNAIEALLKTKSSLEDILDTQESSISRLKSMPISSYSNELKIENLSSLIQIDVDNLLVNKTNDFVIFMESNNSTLKELETSYEESELLLYELEAEIAQIENQVKRMNAISTSDVPYLQEINVVGNVEVNGTATIGSLFTDYLNDVNVDILMNNLLVSDKKIIGNKIFPSIIFSGENLKVIRLNGVPVEHFQFEEDDSHHTDVDFSKIKKLELKDHLNFSKINGVYWNKLMDQVVLKNKKKIIPGSTKFSGLMNTSFTQTSYLNGFEYPSEYVLKSGPGNGEVSGIKTVDTLTVSELRDVKTINDIDADEFIILTADQNLEHQIIFENLVIEESLQIDGKITGLPEQYINPDLTLLNSNTIQSNAMFSNLYVTGKIYVENLLDGIEWTEIDDLILKTDKRSIVSGAKFFSNNVQILGNLEIKTSVINGHPVNNFITLDSRQILPHLSKITGKIKFENVAYDELENIEDKLRMNLDEMGVPNCSMKPFQFLKPPVVDEFSSSFINENITGSEFADKLETLLSDMNFVNLKCRKLKVKQLKPLVVNNVTVEELKLKKVTRNTYQELSGRMKINNLETNHLSAQFINNRSHEQLEDTIRQVNSFYKEFLDSGKSIYSLHINNVITTPKINGINLHDFLDLNEIAEFWLRTNGSIENLTVKGLINNINFTEKISDCVLKTEEFIIIKGDKKFDRFKSQNLQVEWINSHPVQDILTDWRNQTLVGSLIIKGSASVTTDFNSHGKINDFDYQNIRVNIKQVSDKMYSLTGDFSVDQFTSINNLMVGRRVQKRNIIGFLDNLIYLNDTKVMISSPKVFSGTVNFNNYVTALKRWNNVELQLFNENAILVDNSSSVNSLIIFENDVLLEKDLTVINSLKVSTIRGINVENMMENAVYFNRPTSLTERVTLSNTVFQSDITVEFWNNTHVDMFFRLNDDEDIQDPLICVNVNVENLTITGSLNNQNLTKVYENTFMISTDQHITSKMSFLNNIYIRDNLTTRYMNDLDITKIVPLDSSDPMEGNFVFDSPVVIDENVIVLQYLNNINISPWQSNAITMSSPTKMILYGNWTIDGNVNFNGNARGSGFINDASIDSLTSSVRRQNKEMRKFILNKMDNIETICKNLQDQKKQTDHLLHKFKSFEYLRVLQFDKKIESVHHFEFNNKDYILVNFEACDAEIYAYTNEGFSIFTAVSQFGNIKHYLHFNYKNNLYLVTAGKAQCGRNSGNLWVLQKEQIKHVYDLGNVTSMEKLSEITFAVIVDHQVQQWSIEKVHLNAFQPLSIRSVTSTNINFFTHGTDTLFASCDVIYQFQNETSELNEFRNPFKSSDILSFKAGILQKEHILLHDDQINSDMIFIYNEDIHQPKELQSIQAHKPNSFNIINFEGFYESLLVFSENKRDIKIYEYKGIEYFKFHSSLQMKVDKLYSFQLRKHPYFVKRRCVAIVHDSKLTILEAKMYGEKINANHQLICTNE